MKQCNSIDVTLCTGRWDGGREKREREWEGKRTGLVK